MEILSKLVKCELCGKSGEDLSRFSANHKELGLLMVCKECWMSLYGDNRMVTMGTGSSNSSNKSPCAGCSNSACRF